MSEKVPTKRAPTAGSFKKGDPRAGRPKGRKNNRTLEIQAFARRMVEDPIYRDMLAKRLAIGKAPHMETLLFAHAYGKPPDKVELTGSDGEPLGPLVAVYVPDNGRRDRSGRDDG